MGKIYVPEDKLNDLIIQAYNLSVPKGFGFNMDWGSDLSEQDISKVWADNVGWPPNASNVALRVDYLKGRSLKLTVYKEEGSERLYIDKWYDHTQEDLDQLVERLGLEREAA